MFLLSNNDNNELKCINVDTPCENIEKSPNESICLNIYNEDIDKNVPNDNNCKCYTIEELQCSKYMGNLNIFHNNLNGLKINLRHFTTSYLVLIFPLILWQ